jgi:tetratricopeptide (TPR) repeat protein
VRQFVTDLSTGRQIWADTCRVELSIARLMPVAEQIARQVACKISSEYGIIARQLSVESKHIPSLQLTTYEAILRYLEFNTSFARSSFFDAVEALRQACRNDPECGLVWSMLSRLYGFNYATELFELDTPIKEAISFAQIGVKLDPNRQRTRAALAYALMLADEIPAARMELDRALALNPESLIFIDLLGYLLTLLGDWKRGPALITKAVDTNPYYSVVVHYALWLDLFRRGAYEKAYQETLKLRNPELFWDPLAKAATLGRLGRIEEGRCAAEELLRLKPDFARRGRVLIGRYVKSDKIVEQMIRGLNRVGVDCGGADAVE